VPVRGAGARLRDLSPEMGTTMSPLPSLRHAPALSTPAWFLIPITHTIGTLPTHSSEWQNELFQEGVIAFWILIGALAIVVLALHYLRCVARQHGVALRANEERYRLIAERSTDLIAVVDDEGRIHYASPSFQPTLGYDPARIIGQAALTHMHPDDVAGTTTRLAPAFTHGSGQATFRLRHADGAWRWIEAQSSPLLDTNQPTAMIVGRDITERRRLEAELYHAQKLHSLGRLTSGVVHDFNNLLTGIAGFAELGLHSLPSGHAIREDLEEIRGIAGRAAALASHLLAFVRKQSMEPHLIDLNDVVRNLDKLLRRLLGADIEFVNLIAHDLSYIKADPSQIEQVLLNLVINARDAMPQGGTLTIATSNVSLSGGQGGADCIPGEYVLLTVSDTGMGMDAATQARLFEPFFTTKSREHGTGLGLSTCYRIIRAHGGDIRIASSPGHGTTASVYLPRIVAIDTDTPATSSQSAAALPRGTETVLVVEDEKTVRALATRVLRDLGYTVLEALDGTEALQLIKEHHRPIHVLLTNVMLPRVDGKMLAERLVTHYPEVQVIFMSGAAESSQIGLKQFDSGALFLQKPFSCAALASIVREALDRHKVSC
jgi:two-component system, cell cycle sensor histidine kinase and response regulator CckA